MHRSLSAALVSVVALLSVKSAGAQQHPHSSGRLGTVRFATSCAPAVAVTFDRAVALLHSFEFANAIAAFDGVLATDSLCAMAHWGIALSRWGNPFAANIRNAAQLRPGRDAAERATRAPTATDRERGYIAAVSQLYANYEHTDQRSRIVAYDHAMGELAAAQPADTEATIFYALALAASAPPQDKTYANQRRAAEMLETFLASHPNHPGLAHYLIHSRDIPALAAAGLDAANRYGAIAPAAPHALHMPSHIYTRVGAWQESIETNLKSIAAATLDGSMSEALHASDYAMYAYLQTGQDRAAKALLAGIPALAVKFDPHAIESAAPGSAGVFALATIPARWALERRAWAEAAALTPVASEFPWADAQTYVARALGAAHMGDLLSARASIDSLRSMRDRLSATGEVYWTEQTEIAHLTATAWLALAEHRDSSALALMRQAAGREAMTEKNAVTPGPLAPASELLADMLLDLHQPQEALSQYRATLEKEPNRFRALYGATRAARLVGDRAAASRYAMQLRKNCTRGDVPGRAELAKIRRGP